MHKFSHALQWWQLNKGIKTGELATILGVSDSTVSAMRHKQTKARVHGDTERKYAEAFGVKVEDFYKIPKRGNGEDHSEPKHVPKSPLVHTRNVATGIKGFIELLHSERISHRCYYDDNGHSSVAIILDEHEVADVLNKIKNHGNYDYKTFMQIRDKKYEFSFDID